ncbi:endonuclease/exonuclease/phosphatase family protein [Streptomyces sp. NRRL F-5727]|uniref:endonuclease/exonuclease/phosphatase family protein n=1 Tax=Streptomyces sp. NRRL F-5727 TaxID=1463871 RepID=UPI0004CB427D|nr:endonuclease/exonuclease/phosphatase family protein [Streptomyces sp. NRRL F-5727]
MRIRGILAAFAVALSVVLMAGLAQSGADWLRADRPAVTQTERTTTDAAADAGPGTQVQLRSVTFNMCGGYCNKGGTDLLQHVENEITRFAPVHLIMLQEVCYSQFEWFQSKYAGTYEFSFTPLLTNYPSCGQSNCVVNEDSDPNNDDRRCWVGQVLGARGALGPKDEIPLGGESHQIDSSGNPIPLPRTFNALCHDATLTGVPGKVKGCSVHLRAWDDPEGVNDRARSAQAARLASELDEDIDAGKVVVVGGDFNSVPQPHKGPALDSFYRSTAAPGGGIGRFYEADTTDDRDPDGTGPDPALWTMPEPDCVAPSTTCRSGESTLLDLSTLDDDQRNSKIDHLFFSEATTTGTLSGGVYPLYFSDAARTKITYNKADAAKDANGKYLKLSDHAFYRGWSTVTVEP